jgi:hypothetical protein
MAETGQEPSFKQKNKRRVAVAVKCATEAATGQVFGDMGSGDTEPTLIK